MATTSDPTNRDEALTEDVYADIFDFYSTAQMIMDPLDVESGDQMYGNAAQFLIDAMRRDAVKLYALLDLVHDMIMKQGAWAEVVAVKFYR